jgi:hypothetical protein
LEVEMKRVQRRKNSRRSKGITRTVIKSPFEKWWDGAKRRWGPRIMKGFAFIGAVAVIVVAVKEIL